LKEKKKERLLVIGEENLYKIIRCPKFLEDIPSKLNLLIYHNDNEVKCLELTRIKNKKILPLKKKRNLLPNPKKIKLIINLIKIIFIYSAKKIKANPPEEYSTLKPDTNSDSPSAKSKGVRLVSAKQETNHIKNKGIKKKTNNEYS